MSQITGHKNKKGIVLNLQSATFYSVVQSTDLTIMTVLRKVPILYHTLVNILSYYPSLIQYKATPTRRASFRYHLKLKGFGHYLVAKRSSKLS